MDATLGRQSRTLDDSDLQSDEKYVGPATVVIAARFVGFADTSLDKQLRLRLKADADEPSQWLVYPFRPRVEARTRLWMAS